MTLLGRLLAWLVGRPARCGARYPLRADLRCVAVRGHGDTHRVIDHADPRGPRVYAWDHTWDYRRGRAP